MTTDGAPGATPNDAAADFLVMPPGARYSVRFPMALAFAAAQHAAQPRKDDRRSPYVIHLMAVAGGVLTYGWGDERFLDEIEDLAIAAVLHDLAEDHGGERKLVEIEDMFGSRVAEVVRAATDSFEGSPAEKAPWRQRKEEHIARVAEFAAGSDGVGADEGACLVIACDKLHNLTSTADEVAAKGDDYLLRFKGGVDGTRWYYRSMYESLRPALAPDLAGKLAEQLERLGA